jgi:adenosine deaminase
MRRRTFLELLAAIATQSETWHDRLPKVELHLHLEGAVPRATLWELITKYGGDATIKARQRVRYVEGFFSPPNYRRSKLDPQRVTEALRTGVNRVRSIEIAFVPDLVRDRGAEHALNLLERMAEVKSLGVIGIGIGGYEPGFPPEMFETTFERARALGLRTTAHAGEASGAASVWGAVRALRVDRIGHATRAIEDPELVKHLAARRIPLELCPLSNLRTGVITSVEAHPLRQYFDAGIPVTLNTDDPLFFGNSLAMELESAQRVHRFTRDEIRRLLLSSIESTWLSAERKKQMAAEFQRDPSWREAG